MTERENGVDRFFADVVANAELRGAFLAVMWERDDIVALGQKHGYEFTRHDLDGFIRNGSLLAVAGAALLALGVGTIP